MLFLSIHQIILEKKLTVSTKILSSTTVSNFDNIKKYFLSNKSAY